MIPNVKSPNAGNLGSYGDIPVSLFTGNPNISIPIHNVSGRNISVPITLDYNISLLKPDQHPGWVGLGWTLNTGGVITLKRKDMYDESPPLYGNCYNNSGGCYYHQTLNSGSWYSLSYLAQTSNNSPSLYELDTEPDEFSFNFLGITGKFYYNHLGEWKVRCDQDVKVYFDPLDLTSPFVTHRFFPLSCLETNYPLTFKKFKLVTPDGTQYIFGDDPNAIEYSIDMFKQYEDDWYADSWYLTKIISADGKTLVSFNYERDNFINDLDINVLYNDYSFSNPQGFSCSGSSHNAFANGDLNPVAALNGRLISPVYLDNIESDLEIIKFHRSQSIELRYDNLLYQTPYNEFNSHITFSVPLYYHFLPYLTTSNSSGNYDWQGPYDPTEPHPYSFSGEVTNELNRLQWMQLDRISINSKTPDNAHPNNIKESRGYDFIYSSNPQQRLTLLSLSEYSGGPNYLTKPPYKFFYNQTEFLPNYLSLKVDHWGFYNGTLAIPNENNFNAYHDKRNANSNYLFYGSLTRIIYPTGGYSEFTYEPHDCSKYVDLDRTQIRSYSPASNRLIGGLRIKKIKDVDPVANSIKQKEFIYKTSYSNSNSSSLSSGVLGGLNQYYWHNVDYSDLNSNFNLYETTFSIHSFLPNSTNSYGSHIGYTEVVEKMSDGSYNIYKYSNFDNGYTDESPISNYFNNLTQYCPFTDLSFERGKLLEQKSFNNNDILLSFKSNEYSEFIKNTEFIRAAYNFPKNNLCSAGSRLWDITAYKNYFFPFLLTKETLTQYDQTGNNPIISVKEYYYDSPEYKLVTKEKTTNSDNIEHYSYNKYPWHSSFNGTPSINDERSIGISQLRKYNSSEIVQKINTIKQSNGLEFAIGGNLKTYKLFNNFPSEYENYNLNVSQPVPFISSYSDHWSEIIAGAFSFDSKFGRKITYESYDLLGNLIQLYLENGGRKSFKWNFKAVLPNAIFEIASNSNNLIGNECSFTSFEGAQTITGQQPDEDFWKISNLASIVNTDAHTGKFSQKIEPAINGLSYSADRSFSPDNQHQKYIFSAWIKTYAGFSNNAGSLIASVSENNNNSIAYLKKQFSHSSNWQFLQLEINLNDYSSAPHPLRFQCYAENGDANYAFLIDDLRLEPFVSFGTTYTYDELTKQLSSKSDNNGSSTFFEYEDFGRLKVIKNKHQEILNEYSYNISPVPFFLNSPLSITLTRTNCNDDFPQDPAYLGGMLHILLKKGSIYQQLARQTQMHKHSQI